MSAGSQNHKRAAGMGYREEDFAALVEALEAAAVTKL